MIRALVEQYADMAAFLWCRRDAAVLAPHHTLSDIEALDERMEAHLDGLRIAGKTGWSACAAALEDGSGPDDAGAVFAAAVLAFEGEDDRRASLVLERAEPSVDLSRGVVSALGWLPRAKGERWVAALLEAGSPALRRTGVAASAVLRRDPGAALDAALESDDPDLQGRALRAVGELGRADRMDVLRAAMRSDEPACRFEAAWSAAVLGAEDATPMLCALAAEDIGLRAARDVRQSLPYGVARAERACHAAFRRMPIEVGRRRLAVLASAEGSRRVAAIAAGALGDPAQIPWLVETMEIPEAARAAGEAFTTITGVALRGAWRAERPAGFRGGPSDDPDDDDVAMDPDEALPWPRVETIRAWWERSAETFAPDVRYLLGRPITQESALHVLAAGFQRHRAAAALELAGMRPGAPIFEVRAPARRQIALLRAVSEDRSRATETAAA